MICEDEFKDLKVDPQQCHTCLSVNRKLSPLGANVDLLRKIIPQYGYWSTTNMESIGVCWECSNFLLKIMEFQNKVIRAIEILQLGQAYLYSTLSNLTSVIFNDSSPNIIYLTEAEKKPESIDTIDHDVKEYDTGDISDEFTQTTDIETIKVESEEDVKIKKGKNKWAEKKALLNKKPKFKLILDYRDVFTKVKINSQELELCLEKERNSESYKMKRYKCESCVIGFRGENALAGHNERCHNQSIGPYICDICHTRTSKKRQIARHVATHCHKYECGLCPYVCYHKQHRPSHWKRHSIAFQCIKCELKFGSRREFFKHYKEWHENFICHHCGVSFKMRYCIKNHIRKQHSPFVCKQCDKRFARYNGLWLHNKVCHTTPLQGAYCVECDRRYVDVYRYRRHLSNSTRHRPRKKLRIPCPGCDKVFTKKIYMKDHYDLVHLRKYKYRCEQCDKNFLRNADLLQHRRRIHEGILPPRNKICYMCGRGFTTNKILSNHMRTHTGERPFACARCSAAFAQRVALVAHIKAKHHS